MTTITYRVFQLTGSGDCEKTAAPLIEVVDTVPRKDNKKREKAERKNAKAKQALLNVESGMKNRYAISEWYQMWIVLRRALLFSRRDWVTATKFFYFFVWARYVSQIFFTYRSGHYS